MAADRSIRAWPWVIAFLAIALVAVLAAGAWATWRPLSEHDAARLTARDIVTSVDESPRDVVPQDTTDRQLSALGPAATPAQRDRLEDMRGTNSGPDATTGTPDRTPQDAASADTDLTTAGSRMTELATDQEDPDLAATMAGIAASWSAEVTRQDGTAQPLMQNDVSDERAPADAGSQEAEAEVTERCTPELTAVATQIDRALFTAQSADARGTDFSETARALTGWQESLQRIQDHPAVESLYECEPRPARGGYELPRDIADDPEAASGEVAQDVSAYAQGAISTVTPIERVWLMDVLESSARTQALLQPSDPVPALAGEHQVSDR